MTKLTAGPAGLNMTTDIDFSDYPDAVPTTANSGKVIFNSGGFDVTMKGAGFTYGGPNEFPADGTITSIRVTFAGNPVLSITRTSLDVSDMRDAIDASQPQLILNAMLGGDDKVLGGRDGSNVLFALGGDDLVAGGNADDTLDGGAGNDTLFGGRGSDVLTGGAASDLYVFSSTLDSRKSSPDVIIGLDDASDIIDLRAIDANVNKTGNQAFEIVSAFTGDEGEMTLSYNFASYITTVSMDVDGDAKADMIILIDGVVGGFEDHSDFTNFIF